jgi:hypothetical protein
VLGDVSLQKRLRDTEDKPLFHAMTVTLGRQRGFHFHTGDVEEALRVCRRDWIERGLRRR